MDRLATRFNDIRARGHTALVFFITAGDPSPEATVPLMHALVEAGTDVIELGIPFSDPMADGPVLQRASERALRNGTRLATVLEMVREFRRTDTSTPVVLMGYANPIEAMGNDRFCETAADCGVDGVLVVDLPPEESGPLAAGLHARGLRQIRLVAPTTTDGRMDDICHAADGFVYYIAVKGTTGGRAFDADPAAAAIRRLRPHTGLPIGVGFGIRDPQAAAEAARIADAVIVGSALVQRIEQSQADLAGLCGEVAQYARQFRGAIDESRRARA
ncbi:MAG: tryptophan synthase subunit alpha [Gammaproteobacteria bacterium]